MHIEIYKGRPDVNAIVHAHNPYTLGLTLAGVKFEIVSAEGYVLTGGRIGYVPYAPPGSQDLAKLVSEKAMEGYKAIVMENHGVIALAPTLLEAEAIVETLEEMAIATFISKTLGVKPKPIK